MHRSLACTVALSMLLAGCATTDGPAATSPAVSAAPGTVSFRTTDFAWSTAPGRGQIQGQLAYKPKGVAYSCAAAGVVLTPETPWVRQRMSILYSSADAKTLPAAEVRMRTPPERSQDYSTFVRRAACDAAGQFALNGLPDGAWFVITVARPVNPTAGQEMAIMRRVVVRNGGVVKVKL